MTCADRWISSDLPFPLPKKIYEHDINWDIVGRGVKLSVFSNGFCLSNFFCSFANYALICGLPLFSVMSISGDCQKRKCSLILEFVDLKFTNDFSYLCLWLLAKFHGLVEPTKITKINIQWTKQNSQCFMSGLATHTCVKKRCLSITQAIKIHHILQTT